MQAAVGVVLAVVQQEWIDEQRQVVDQSDVERAVVFQHRRLQAKHVREVDLRPCVSAAHRRSLANRCCDNIIRTWLDGSLTLGPLCVDSHRPPRPFLLPQVITNRSFSRGVSPLRGPGCCAARRAAVKAQRLAPSGGHPSRGLAATLRARWRAGCRRAAAPGALPVRSPMQRSRLRLHRDAEVQIRPAVPAELTTAARSRARGSRALFPSRVRERGPLDELADLQVVALRSVRCTPVRSSPRSPAMPDAGPLNPMK